MSNCNRLTNDVAGYRLSDKARFLEKVRSTGFAIRPQLALVSTQSHYQFLIKALSVAKKWPQHDGGHLSVFDIYGQNIWCLASTALARHHRVSRGHEQHVFTNLLTRF
jgi:hypothetical protein